MKFYVALVIALRVLRAEGQSLLESLNSTRELADFIALLRPVWGELGDLSNITLLAPNNEGVTGFLNSSLGATTAASTDNLRALLEYHIVDGVYTSFPTSTTLRTVLHRSGFSNVTGGQRMLVSSDEIRGTMFTSGLLQHANTNGSSITFDKGIIHKINSVLRLPQNIKATAKTVNLTSVIGAIEIADLTNTLDSTIDITMFLPINSAFQKVGGNLAGMSTEDLARTLLHHVVNGTFSLGEKTVTQSMAGRQLSLQVDSEGNQYIDNAKILVANVPVINGIVHIIDEVLNPDNDTIYPISLRPEQEFPEPTRVSDAPFTSGVPTPSLGIPLPYSIVSIITSIAGPTDTALAQVPLSPPSKDTNINIGVVVGGVVGGISGATLISLLVWFFTRRQRANKPKRPLSTLASSVTQPEKRDAPASHRRFELEAPKSKVPPDPVELQSPTITIAPIPDERNVLYTSGPKRLELAA